MLKSDVFHRKLVSPDAQSFFDTATNTDVPMTQRLFFMEAALNCTEGALESANSKVLELKKELNKRVSLYA